PDRWPHFRRCPLVLVPVPVVVRRSGGRRRRQDCRAEQQGDDRVGQVRGCPLAGMLRRGRAFLGRFEQQPRLSRRHHQLDQQRRLDLYRGQAQARLVPDRAGQADQGRHLPYKTAEGSRRPVHLPDAVHQHGDGLFEEPEGGQGLPTVGQLEADLRRMVYLAAGLLHRPHQGLGEGSGVERRSDHVAVQDGRRDLDPLCRLRRPVGTPRRRGRHQIRDHRYVRQSDSGDGARRGGEVGAWRARQDLRLSPESASGEEHMATIDAITPRPYAGAPRRGPITRLLEDERWLASTLLLPTILLLGLFIAYPFIKGVLLAVTDTKVGIPGNFVGLANFDKLWHDDIFRVAVYNTFLYTFVTTVFKLVLGLWLALLLNRHFRGKAFVRAFILLPFIIPTVLSTFAWKWMFDPTFSVINWMLFHLGM